MPKGKSNIKKELSEKINKVLGFEGEETIDFTKLTESELIRLYSVVLVFAEKSKYTITKDEMVEKAKKIATKLVENRPILSMFLSGFFDDEN